MLIRSPRFRGSYEAPKGALLRKWFAAFKTTLAVLGIFGWIKKAIVVPNPIGCYGLQRTKKGW